MMSNRCEKRVTQWECQVCHQVHTAFTNIRSLVIFYNFFLNSQTAQLLPYPSDFDYEIYFAYSSVEHIRKTKNLKWNFHVACAEKKDVSEFNKK